MSFLCLVNPVGSVNMTPTACMLTRVGIVLRHGCSAHSSKRRSGPRAVWWTRQLDVAGLGMGVGPSLERQMVGSRPSRR
jgi:hypothetical protein